MDELINLTKIVSLKKVRQIEIISENADLPKLANRLYKGIVSGEIKDDASGMLVLYGKTSQYEAFRKLKYRFKQRMINTLFFIDVQGYSIPEYHKALLRNNKNMAAFIILLLFGHRNSAIDLAENILTSALKFDMLEVSLIILKELKKHYALYDPVTSKYKKYKDLFEKIKEDFLVEIDSDDFFIEMGIAVRKKSAVFDDRLKGIEEKLYAFSKQNENNERYFYNYNVYNSKYFLALIKKDYQAMNEICDQAIGYFNKKKGFPGYALVSFNLKHAITYIYFRKHEDADLKLNTCLDIMKHEVNVNWYNIHNFKFLNAVIQKDYEKGLEIVSKAVSNRKFKNIYRHVKEHWMIIEAYYHYLILLNVFDKELIEAYPLRKFKLTKFINEIETHFKDKKGLNISVQIIEILMLIVEKKYKNINNRLAALSQYAYRYLTTQKRSYYFIKMLAVLPDMEYNPQKIQKKIDKYYQKLKETPLELTEQELQIEIIPYENLWEITMRHLGKS